MVFKRATTIILLHEHARVLYVVYKRMKLVAYPSVSKDSVYKTINGTAKHHREFVT